MPLVFWAEIFKPFSIKRQRRLLDHDLLPHYHIRSSDQEQDDVQGTRQGKQGVREESELVGHCDMAEV